MLMSPVELTAFRGYLTLLARQQLRTFTLTALDVDDLVQETFNRALQSLDKFRGENSREFAVWLRTILTNILRDKMRREQRVVDEQKLQFDIEQSSVRLDRWLECGELTPRRRALRDESFLQLAASLLNLATDQRMAIELRYLQGLGIKEIAEAMQRSTASVGGLLQRGLAALRNEMQGVE